MMPGQVEKEFAENVLQIGKESLAEKVVDQNEEPLDFLESEKHLSDESDEEP